MEKLSLNGNIQVYQFDKHSGFSVSRNIDTIKKKLEHIANKKKKKKCDFDPTS